VISPRRLASRGWYDRCYEIVAHAKGRSRSSLNKDIEKAKDRVPNYGIALQFQRPSVDVALQQDHEHEYCVRIREHSLTIYGGE